MGDLYVPCLRVARLFVSRTAVRDRGLGETVCSVSHVELARHLSEVIGGVDWRVVYLFRRGLVLTDTRGRGFLQKIDDDELNC